jgi:NAD(P)-dependent dehydrogenase (short-subunit alcohol dehydrogenase family)
MPPLAGSRALVIGGVRRLGRAIALGLAEHGADVVVTSRSGGADADETADAVRALGRRSAAIACDVHSVDQLGMAVAAASKVLDGLDVLVYAAAGGFRASRPDDVDAALFDEAVGTILRGGFFAAQAAHAQMTNGGVIVFITDVAAMQAWPSFAPHSVAKAGLVHLTEILAKAWAPEVRVCGVAPGTVLPERDSDSESLARAAGAAALARVGSPDDIAGAVRYLIEADYVTGIQLVVDGGRLL